MKQADQAYPADDCPDQFETAAKAVSCVRAAGSSPAMRAQQA
jgi:hypothetical protein